MSAILLFWKRNWGEGTRIEMLGRRRHSELEGLKRKKRSLEQLLRHFTETEVFNIYACFFPNSIRME